MNRSIHGVFLRKNAFCVHFCFYYKNPWVKGHQEWSLEIDKIISLNGNSICYDEINEYLI